ncbi:MAG: nicotinate (nicotinamide) nucleotide adenylyltransferase [Balneolaceae bacterium]|nr:nicotinate (nicotinamide) nucleotide adenylyltransferase [Balneolaceae bacterium]
MVKRIGLFGGTFDPVHKGHESIADSFLNSEYIDELWVLLTPFPPHKKEQNHAPYKFRLQMLKAVFSAKQNIRISTVENQLPKPSFSVQTIRHLKKNYPENNFLYCMGEDSLAQFNQWKFYQEILEECELLVAHRPGSHHDDVEQKILEKTHFVDHVPLAISSTEVKEAITRGEASIKEKLDKQVCSIIDKEQLYS